MDMVVQRADGLMTRITRRMGSIPIMVKSAGCYLRDLDRCHIDRPRRPSLRCVQQTSVHFTESGIGSRHVCSLTRVGR